VWLQSKGTVQPVSPFDSNADAKILHDALTANKNQDIANLLTKRSCKQRLEIKSSFEKAYGVSLICYMEGKVECQ